MDEVATEVLEFYRELPFNYGTDVEFQAQGVRKTNPTSLHPPLRKVVESQRILEVGSGAGWFSNGLAFHHRSRCLGIDFNPVAVKRAVECAAALQLDSEFRVADLYTFQSPEKFPIVVSLGVLHHTGDCHSAIRHICDDLLADHGLFYLGLYHLYGRRPFLDHFAALRKMGWTIDQLETEFLRLYGHKDDTVHLRSWFRDQVLHPHETQHTYAEIRLLLGSLGLFVRSTSLNKFKKIKSHQFIEDEETKCETVAHQAIRDGRYYPGFFTVLAQKK